MLTQPTAKATWQVDTPPAAEAPLPLGKAGAGKACVDKPGVQAPKAPTPTDSSPLPSDALDEDLPSGPVRYSIAKRCVMTGVLIRSGFGMYISLPFSSFLAVTSCCQDWDLRRHRYSHRQ